MIIIEQAIYGEVPGKTLGHDLLAASDEKNELFRYVSGITDLADRPQGGVLAKPIVRGLLAEEHFLLVKNFPDQSPGLRSGRVFAHVLFIRMADLQRVTNISQLFRFHMLSIQKEAKMSLLEYDTLDFKNLSDTLSGREAAATNALLQKKNFAWLEEKGYWEWIDSIWPQLSLEAKYSVRVGAAFNPSYIKDENLNLIYIPAEAKTLWERNGFRVLDAGESEKLQSGAAHWLVGNTKEAAPFQTLLDDFAPKVSSIDLLNRLQNNGNVYHRLNQNPELNRLLVLSNFISGVNPNEKSGTKGKSRLLAAILQAIPTATTDQIKALSYQSWRGFLGALESSSVALSKWLSKHILNSKNAKQGGSVLIMALKAPTSNWWANTVLRTVKERLKKRQYTDAPNIWRWVINEPELIDKHASWLPGDAEDELSQKLPKLETATAELVLGMAAQKGWFLLHAKVVAQQYSPLKAIEAQLRIDTNEKHTEAFEFLSKSIKGNAFVPIAASHLDIRLHRIAGKLIAGNSRLLIDVKITSEGWQKCWEAALEEGGDVWAGIPTPKDTLFEVLDHLLAGNQFSNPLLQAISSGSYSSLKDYPKRSSIWQKLPNESRSGFISATLLDLIDEIAIGQLEYNNLETDLKIGLQKEEVQDRIIRSEVITLTKKIHLIEILPVLGTLYAQQLIRGHLFSRAEAEQFGKLVMQKGWSYIADDLYTQRHQRKDIVPALLECSELLGFIKRLKLSASGLKRDAISTEEWWDEFWKISTKLFPVGPEESGLWISAGGELSQLHLTGTGRYKWSHAIQILRNQGDPETGRLVKKMRELNSGNETLKFLQETL
jgi:hypothetical protein